MVLGSIIYGKPTIYGTLFLTNNEYPQFEQSVVTIFLY